MKSSKTTEPVRDEAYYDNMPTRGVIVTTIEGSFAAVHAYLEDIDNTQRVELAKSLRISEGSMSGGSASADELLDTYVRMRPIRESLNRSVDLRDFDFD